MHASTHHPDLTNAIAAASQQRHAIQCVKQTVYFIGSVLTPENLLMYVCEGCFTIHYGERTYEMRKGQVACIKKHLLVEYHTDADASCFVFAVKQDIMMEFGKLASLSQFTNAVTGDILVADAGTQVLNYMSSLRPYFFGGESLEDNLVKIKMLELLFCLAASHPSMIGQLLVVKESFRPDITRIVEENIMNGVSLSQLARSAGRSLSSFRRDFLAIYNMPPSRWIRQKRLEKAQELLVSTNMTITDICYTLGFENLAHFSRIFKSRFGCPPSELRVNTIVA